MREQTCYGQLFVEIIVTAAVCDIPSRYGRFAEYCVGIRNQASGFPSSVGATIRYFILVLRNDSIYLEDTLASLRHLDSQCNKLGT